MPLNFYNCRFAPPGYRITKFDSEYNVEGTYLVQPREGTHGWTCECPAGHRPTCRHRDMLPKFIKDGHLDDGWFLRWDNRQWARPVQPEAQDKIDQQLADEIAADQEAKVTYSELVDKPTELPAALAPIERDYDLALSSNQPAEPSAPTSGPASDPDAVAQAKSEAASSQITKPQAEESLHHPSSPPASGLPSGAIVKGITKDGLKRI